MVDKLTKMTADVNVISKLDNYPPDDPGMTPDKLKSLFDKGSNTIKDYINNTLLPQLEQGYTGANGEGSGDMMQAVYDPTGKNTDIFNYVDEGLSGKVDNSRVLTDVPANAKFTDTITSINGKTGTIAKADVVALGIPAQDTVYTHPPTHPASMITDLPTGKKVARFVIGTSTAGWTAADCDYLCGGTADQTEINAAITALPATGGEIVILDGTYNIAAKIDVTKDNVSIRGNGNATILKRTFNSPVKEGVITLTSRSGCKIANLQIDGNKTSYTNSNNYGINLSDSNSNTITGNTCNSNNYGINLSGSNSNNTITSNVCNSNNYGINLSGSNSNTITGNTCNSNNYGIYLVSSSNNNTITSNVCNNSNYNIRLNSSSNNTITSNVCNNSNSGIYLVSSSNNNTITGNTCNNNNSGIYLYTTSNNTITGNTCNNNNVRGIFLFSSSNNNTITSNTCNNNGDSGIHLTDSNSNTITGNTCVRGTGLTTDYTVSQHTIQLNGTGNNYNLISNNNCMGKAVTNEGGTGNTLVNNKFDAT